MADAPRAAVPSTAVWISVSTSASDVSAAVEKAVNTVVNSQFAFDEVNGKPFRMLKGLEGVASEVGDVLQFFVDDAQIRSQIVGFAEIPPTGDPSIDGKQKYKEEIKECSSEELCNLGKAFYVACKTVPELRPKTKHRLQKCCCSRRIL